jgi:hypothetical protein
VLRETSTFVEQDDVPSNPVRQESLVFAREGCRTVLNEVDDFLDKYSSLGQSRRRVIEMMKFIIRDTKALEKKLESATSLLQLSLSSLSR